MRGRCYDAPEDLTERGMHPGLAYMLQRKYCDGCPVIMDCLRTAFADSKGRTKTDSAQGVWGGAVFVDGRLYEPEAYRRWWQFHRSRMLGRHRRRREAA